MTIDPLFLAFLAIVPSLVTGALTFILARQTAAASAKLQPTQIRAVEVAAKQDEVETDTIAIANSREIYGAYKELVADMAEVLRKQVTLEGRVATLEQENGVLKTKLAAALEEVAQSEARYQSLEKRTADYPRRLELAEAEIASLKATIVQQSIAAAQVSSTANADAMTRRSEADTALIAAGGVPMKDLPAPAPSGDARSVQSGDNVIITAVDEPPPEAKE